MVREDWVPRCCCLVGWVRLRLVGFVVVDPVASVVPVSL